MKWDEVAQPDVYSCLSDGNSIRAIGWILRCNDEDECVFYTSGACGIYEWRPMICRCYPFFMGERGVEVMHCNGLGRKLTKVKASEMGKLMKRYEIKKLQSYISIIKQLGDKLNIGNIRQLPQDFSGNILVYDGEAMIPVTVRRAYKK